MAELKLKMTVELLYEEVQEGAGQSETYRKVLDRTCREAVQQAVRHGEFRTDLHPCTTSSLTHMTVEVVEPPDARAALIENLARDQHANDEQCVIDPAPVISDGDDNGAYVQAWVWVNFEGTSLDKEKDEQDG